MDMLFGYAVHSFATAIFALALAGIVIYDLIHFVKKRMIDAIAEKARHIVTSVLAVCMPAAVVCLDDQFWAV